MKVTTIEEAHDITMLKLDELFGSLLTFEMAIPNREDTKGKDIAFKAIHKEEVLDNNKSPNENANESIALLTKQYSKVVKKFKNMDTDGSNYRDQNNF